MPDGDSFPDMVRCPWCGGSDVEQSALFGQTLLSSTWFCHTCRSAFECVRWTAEQLRQTLPIPGTPVRRTQGRRPA